MSLPAHPLAAQRERNARIQQHAERVAARVARAQPSASPDTLTPVVIVPANARSIEPLPQSSRAAFLDRLALLLADAYATTEDETPMSLHHGVTADGSADPSSHDADIVSTLESACATCRGACCTAGGNHAFLRGENLTRLRQAHPTESAESLLAQYALHLPVQHYRDSCIYHSASGCALPRTLRADLCNRYICGGLTQLKNALTASGGTKAYVGAADSVQLLRIAVVSRLSAVPVALGEHAPV